MAPPLRVLVVDDSIVNRLSIENVLAAHEGIEVVGRAKNGEEALQIALATKPDVITLDLEMPRMDGFTFLRILMSKRPTPVIVVSSYGNKETVFRALELGAVDFVARNDAHPEDRNHLKQVVEKVLLARFLRPLPTSFPKTPPPSQQRGRPPLDSFEDRRAPTFKYVVVIAASTGGPTALLEIFARLPRKFPGAILVAQHMPDRFTKTFAERLDKRGAMPVRETKDGDVVMQNQGFVSPGGLVTRLKQGAPAVGEFVLAVGLPTLADRYAPSADALMGSAARVAGARTIGIILTGMGDDGVVGARAIRAAGGKVIAESELTAVVHGMPGAAIRGGVVDGVLPLGDIATYLATLS